MSDDPTPNRSVHEQLRRSALLKKLAIQLRAALPGSDAEAEVLKVIDALDLDHDEFISLFSIGNLQEPRLTQLKRLLEGRMIDALKREAGYR